MSKPARGERDNNPGHIDYSPRNPWKGQLSHDPKIESRFCRFQSPEYGIRAIYKLFHTYQFRDGLNSVAAIINKYAPPNENPTGNYIKRAAADIVLLLKASGELCVCDIYTELNLSQPKTSRYLAMLRESGLLLDSKHGKTLHLNTKNMINLCV